MFLLAGKTPTHKRFVTCFHSKRTSLLKGLCERSSPTLPHTSGWFVPAATPCSKEDKNLPSSTCMKRPSPAISPRPGGAHALLPYQGARGWRLRWGKVRAQPHRCCPDVPIAGCKRHRNALLRVSPWGQSGLPLAVQPWALSEHLEVKAASANMSQLCWDLSPGSRERRCFLT